MLTSWFLLYSCRSSVLTDLVLGYFVFGLFFHLFVLLGGERGGDLRSRGLGGFVFICSSGRFSGIIGCCLSLKVLQHSSVFGNQ